MEPSVLNWTPLWMGLTKLLLGRSPQGKGNMTWSLFPLYLRLKTIEGNEQLSQSGSYMFTGSQKELGNSFLNEVWEFLVDFNYPSYCWTSLAHIIENWLCIIRTTGISSLKAVTLVLFFLILSKLTSSHPSNIQPQKLGRELKFFHYCIFCDLSLCGSFCFIPYFCNKSNV